VKGLSRQQAIIAQRLGHLIEQAHPRVQAGIGVLEDHLHLQAQRVHALRRLGQHVLPVEHHLSR
jgi:hypothetical protein